MSDPTSTPYTAPGTTHAHGDVEGLSTKEAAEDALERAKAKAAGYYARSRERAEEYQEQFLDYVRDNPMKSVLIAAGAGALLGMIWRR